MNDEQDRSSLSSLTESALAASKISKIIAAGAKGGVHGAALEAVNESRGLFISIIALIVFLPVSFLIL